MHPITGIFLYFGVAFVLSGVFALPVIGFFIMKDTSRAAASDIFC